MKTQWSLRVLYFFKLSVCPPITHTHRHTHYLDVAETEETKKDGEIDLLSNWNIIWCIMEDVFTKVDLLRIYAHKVEAK